MVDYSSELLSLFEKRKDSENFLYRLTSELKNAQTQYVCIFGAKELGVFLVNTFLKLNTNIKIDFFCDNDKKKWGREICNNIKCISPEELEIYKNDVAIIIASKSWKEIMEQLHSNHFRKIYPVFSMIYLNFNFFYNDKLNYLQNKYLNVIDMFADQESKRTYFTVIRNLFVDSPVYADYTEICCGKQNFAEGIIELNENEVFVDCGAYDGDTVKQFLQEVHNRFSEVHAFELDKTNYIKLGKTVETLGKSLQCKVSTYNVGLWDKEEIILYNNHADESSRITDQGNAEGKVVPLDSILEGKKVSFIKMDIEGAELQALQGAKNIIMKQQPKLAISIYHSLEDLWQIPSYIKNIAPQYKLYLRHHTTAYYDTICYAIP